MGLVKLQFKKIRLKKETVSTIQTSIQMITRLEASAD